MVWNLFGKKKKKATKGTKVQAQAVADMPPIMAPDDTSRTTLTRAQASGKSSQPAAARPAVSDDRLDALTVMAAIETAKQELAARESAIAQSAKRQKSVDMPATDDPVARKKHLIQAAMTVHRLKQSALDDLSQTDRAKLRGMAETALGVGGKKPKR